METRRFIDVIIEKLNNKLIAIVVGAFVFFQILIVIILKIFFANGYSASSLEVFNIIMVILYLIFSTPFFIILVLYFRRDKFIFGFSIAMILTIIANSFLSLITDLSLLNPMAVFLGIVVSLGVLTGIVSAVFILADKNYKGIISIFIVYISFHTYFFTPFVLSFSNFNFSFGATTTIIWFSYLSFLFVASIVVVLQIWLLIELESSFLQADLRRSKDRGRDKGFSNIIKENIPEDLS